MQRFTSLLALFLLAGLLTAPAASLAVDKPTHMGALGTAQLPGDWCNFGQAYTIGDKDQWPVNFTLISAEYVAVHVPTSKLGSDYPKAGDKLLVVHFSIQNPLQKQQEVIGDVNIVAVDDQGNNHTQAAQCLENVLTASGPNTTLEPGQKGFGYSVFNVPGAGEVTKLIVSKAQYVPHLVARYDMHGHVKPLTAVYADPSDSSGNTIADPVKGQVGVTYSSGLQDFTIESVSTSAGPLTEQEKEWLDSKRGQYSVAVVTAKVVSWDPGNVECYGPTWFRLTNEDGTVCDYDNAAFAADGNRKVDIELGKDERGQPAEFRTVYYIPTGVPLKTLMVKSGQEGEGLRVSIDLSSSAK
jgi:hypothetical protein